MKLFDAINQSPVKAAFRYLTDADGQTPNIVLVDGEKTKAFRAVEHFAWDRRALSVAKRFDDWLPMKARDLPPLVAPDAVTRLGDVV